MTQREMYRREQAARRKNEEALAAVARMRHNSRRQEWEYNVKPVFEVLVQGVAAAVAGVLLFLLALLLTP